MTGNEGNFIFFLCFGESADKKQIYKFNFSNEITFRSDRKERRTGEGNARKNSERVRVLSVLVNHF